LGILRSILKIKPDFVVIVGSTTHLLIFSILFLLGIKPIPSIHITMWRKYKKDNFDQRLITKTNKFFFKKCEDFLCASHDIKNQIVQLTNKKAKYHLFKPYYKKKWFQNIKPVDIRKRPFKILFIGRIIDNKGIFDLLKIAHNLQDKNIVFEICGEGNFKYELNEQINKLGLSKVKYLGFLNRFQLLKKIKECHAIIAPTRTGFTEGFNNVIIESILASRPVITSAVCPAMFDVKDAVMEAKPDDIKSYTQAILDLYKNEKLYKTKQRACKKYQAKYYEKKNSWGYMLKRILLKHIKKTR